MRASLGKCESYGCRLKLASVFAVVVLSSPLNKLPPFSHLVLCYAAFMHELGCAVFLDVLTWLGSIVWTVQLVARYVVVNVPFVCCASSLCQ